MDNNYYIDRYILSLLMGVDPESELSESNYYKYRTNLAMIYKNAFLSFLEKQDVPAQERELIRKAFGGELSDAELQEKLGNSKAFGMLNSEEFGKYYLEIQDAFNKVIYSKAELSEPQKQELERYKQGLKDESVNDLKSYRDALQVVKRMRENQIDPVKVADALTDVLIPESGSAAPANEPPPQTNEPATPEVLDEQVDFSSEQEEQKGSGTAAGTQPKPTSAKSQTQPQPKTKLPPLPDLPADKVDKVKQQSGTGQESAEQLRTVQPVQSQQSQGEVRPVQPQPPEPPSPEPDTAGNKTGQVQNGSTQNQPLETSQGSSGPPAGVSQPQQNPAKSGDDEVSEASHENKGNVLSSLLNLGGNKGNQKVD